jgi:hypothetical protein
VGACAWAGGPRRGLRRRRIRPDIVALRWLRLGWDRRMGLRKDGSDRKSKCTAAFRVRVRRAEADGSLRPAAGPCDVNAQRRSPMPRVVGPNELDDGVCPFGLLRAQSFTVRRIPARRPHDEVRVRTEGFARGSRHRARGRVGGIAGSDQQDECDGVGHRWRSDRTPPGAHFSPSFFAFRPDDRGTSREAVAVQSLGDAGLAMGLRGTIAENG